MKIHFKVKFFQILSNKFRLGPNSWRNGSNSTKIESKRNKLMKRRTQGGAHGHITQKYSEDTQKESGVVGMYPAVNWWAAEPPASVRRPAARIGRRGPLFRGGGRGLFFFFSFFFSFPLPFAVVNNAPLPTEIINPPVGLSTWFFFFVSILIDVGCFKLISSSI